MDVVVLVSGPCLVRRQSLEPIQTAGSQDQTPEIHSSHKLHRLATQTALKYTGFFAIEHYGEMSAMSKI